MFVSVRFATATSPSIIYKLMTGQSGDSKIWKAYNETAKTLDITLVERIKANMDSVLVFVSISYLKHHTDDTLIWHF